MKDILLLGKKILAEQSKVLKRFRTGEDFLEDWEDKGGIWTSEDGWLVGAERGNRGGILLSRDSFADDVMLIFTAASILPATRDVNAVYRAVWDEEANYLKSGYVSGLNGWYDHKSGIERFPENGLNATTTLYRYTPGQKVRLCTGAVGGHNFLVADDTLICELIDPNPVSGGHVGFSPYCTKLRIKDVEVRQIYAEKRNQNYQPEF